MKLTVLQENLQKAVSAVSKNVSTKTQLPVLSNILLSARDGQLQIAATNLESSIVVWVGASIETDGSITVPARVFQELIASFTAEKVGLKVEEDKLKLECGESKATLSGIAASEFPPLPQIPVNKDLQLNRILLEKTHLFVAIAASTDEGRPLLTGIKFLPKDGGLLLVATDGYRLSLRQLPENPGVSEGFVISAKTLSEVFRLAADSQAQNIDVYFPKTASQAVFATENAQIATRLIEGEYPAFERIIPASWTTQVVFDRTELLQAVKFTSVYAREAANIIKFSIKPGRVLLMANLAQVGESQTSLTVKTEGEEGEIAFNARFLLDLLNVFPEESVVFEMTGPLAPGAFKPLEDKSYLHIIMPVRVQG